MDDAEHTMHVLLGCRACLWDASWRFKPHVFCPGCGLSIRGTRAEHLNLDTVCTCEEEYVGL